MSYIHTAAALAAAALLASSCAPGARAAGSAGGADRHATRLSDATLRRFDGRTLHAVVEMWWPAILRSQAAWLGDRLLAARDGPVGVYLNGLYAGGADVLRLIAAENVVYVERVPAIEEHFRYGRRHANGALLVRLGRAR